MHGALLRKAGAWVAALKRAAKHAAAGTDAPGGSATSSRSPETSEAARKAAEKEAFVLAVNGTRPVNIYALRFESCLLA